MSFININVCQIKHFRSNIFPFSLLYDEYYIMTFKLKRQICTNSRRPISTGADDKAFERRKGLLESLKERKKKLSGKLGILKLHFSDPSLKQECARNLRPFS